MSISGKESKNVNIFQGKFFLLDSYLKTKWYKQCKTLSVRNWWIRTFVEEK